MVQSRVTLCTSARRPIRPFTVWSVPLGGDHLNLPPFQGEPLSRSPWPETISDSGPIWVGTGAVGDSVGDRLGCASRAPSCSFFAIPIPLQCCVLQISLLHLFRNSRDTRRKALIKLTVKIFKKTSILYHCARQDRPRPASLEGSGRFSEVSCTSVRSWRHVCISGRAEAGADACRRLGRAATRRGE